MFSFASLIWVGWMAVTVISFWSCPQKYRQLLLAVISFLFLAFHDVTSCVWLCLFTYITYLFTRSQTVGSLQASVAIVLLASVFFGYKALNTTSPIDLTVESLIPMGLTYYILRCIHFIFERFKGRVESQKLTSVASYLFFIPTLWVGPIHRFPEFQKDCRRHRWDAELFSKGLERILYGYVKIVVLATTLLGMVVSNWLLSYPASSQQLSLYLTMVRDGLSLYLLFSGFSDIAIGFGYLLGFKVMENFQAPYLQKNISNFWRCWHISLTSWCRDYIYTTVVSQTRSAPLGALATLIIVAMWHDISLIYLAWGLYHGIGIVIWQYFQVVRAKLPTVHCLVVVRFLDVLSIMLTVHFVWLGFLLVKQPDLSSFMANVQILFLGTTL